MAFITRPLVKRFNSKFYILLFFYLAANATFCIFFFFLNLLIQCIIFFLPLLFLIFSLKLRLSFPFKTYQLVRPFLHLVSSNNLNQKNVLLALYFVKLHITKYTFYIQKTQTKYMVHII